MKLHLFISASWAQNQRGFLDFLQMETQLFIVNEWIFIFQTYKEFLPIWQMEWA